MTDNEAGNPDATDHERRPVVNDQEPTGEQGVSSDRPGVDPGGYPGPSRLPDAPDQTPEPDEGSTTEEDHA